MAANIASTFCRVATPEPRDYRLERCSAHGRSHLRLCSTSCAFSRHKRSRTKAKTTGLRGALPAELWLYRLCSFEEDEKADDEKNKRKGKDEVGGRGGGQDSEGSNREDREAITHTLIVAGSKLRDRMNEGVSAKEPVATDVVLMIRMQCICVASLPTPLFLFLYFVKLAISTA